MTRYESEHLAKRIVLHYANVGKKKSKVLLFMVCWPKIFHVKQSIVSFGSTMSQIDYLMEMTAISCCRTTTKMLFFCSSFVHDMSFTVNL